MKSYQQDPENPAPEDMKAFMDEKKPAKKFKDYVYHSETEPDAKGNMGMINYEATFNSIIKFYEKRLRNAYYPGNGQYDDKVLKFLKIVREVGCF